MTMEVIFINAHFMLQYKAFVQMLELKIWYIGHELPNLSASTVCCVYSN